MSNKKIVFAVFICICLILLIGFFILKNKNKEVIKIDISEEDIKPAITEYLINQNPNKEKCFVSFKIYYMKAKNENLCYVYAWCLSKNYYSKGDIRGGFSGPYKFEIIKPENKYFVINAEKPRDGNYYSKDLERIFPDFVRNEMGLIYSDGTMEMLEEDIQNQVEIYFNKNMN